MSKSGLIHKHIVKHIVRGGDFNHVKGEALTPRLEPGTPGSPEESFATRLFTPEEGKSMEPHT